MSEYYISDESDDITEQPWYWGGLDKEGANRIMADRDHGHFLVRDSSTRGEYTLVVKRNDRVSNIRILRGGRGFCVAVDMGHCHSVAKLIRHLQQDPEGLHRLFPMIDLFYPVEKEPPEPASEKTTYELLTELVMKNKDFLLQNDSYTTHIKRRKLTLKEMQMCSRTVTSLNTVMSLFEDQLALQTAQLSADLMKPGAMAEDPSLTLNRTTVQDRVHTVRRRLQQAEKAQADLETQASTQLEDIHRVKAVLTQMKQDVTHLRLRVEDMGIPKEYLDLLLRDDKKIDVSHYDPRNWEVQCNRLDAERLLANRIPGTFLVRPNRDGGQALSILCASDDRVEARHCLIYQDPEHGRYGFHPQYCIFASVQELVTKHRTITLRFYNNRLDVCLTYPVNYTRDELEDEQ